MPRSFYPSAFTLCILAFCFFTPGSAHANAVASWPFEESSGSIAYDTSGNGHDGALLGGTLHTDGISGLGLSFPTSGDAVEVAASGALGQLQQVSISVWARQAPRGNFTALVDARDNPTDGYDLFFSDTGRLFMRVNQSSIVGSTVVTDGAWHHLVGVWDGLSLTLYVDGVLDATTTIPVTTVDVAAPLLLGRHFESAPQWELSGSLDEVQIYDYALDASQVTALFQGNTTDTTAPLRSNARPAGLLPSGTVEVTLEVDTNEDGECRFAVVPGTPYETMVDVFTTTGGLAHATVVSGLMDGETRTFYLRCADILGNANADDLTLELTIDSVLPGEPGLIGHWPFEDCSAGGCGTIAFDASGNGHDATLLGGASFTTGLIGPGLDLTGAGDYAEIDPSTLIDQPQALTIAAWIQHAARPEFTSIVDKRDSGSDGYDLYLTNTGRAFVRINGSTLAGATVVTDGTWRHITAVWDGLSLALYVDGSLDASQATTATSIDTANPLLLGRHFQGNAQWEFAGLMDEVRLYDRALSPQEIADLAQGSDPIDITPPARSNPGPTGGLPPGTETATLVLDTDEPSQCRWAEIHGTPYEAMPNSFATAQGTTHTASATGLGDGGTYDFAVRCLDEAGNANLDDFLISFRVDTPGSTQQGLLGHWSFEENGGNVALDGSGNGHDADLVGGPQWLPAVSGLGLELTGQGDGAIVPSGFAQGPLSEISITAWIRHGTPASFSSIVDQRDTVDDGYDLFISDTGHPFVRINASTLVGTTPIADDAWHHLAGIWDGNQLAIYVDGQLDATKVIPATTVEVSGALHLGRHFELNSDFESDGTLDEVRIYDRALSAFEISDLTLATGPRLNILPNFPDKHVIQRVGTTANLPLGGSYVGFPAAIEGRLIDATTGAPLAGFDWAVIDPAPTGGQWTGSLTAVPQGGWYRLELRFSNDPGVALTPSARLGVGMVVAALGQSSMAKLFTEIAFTGDGDLGVASQDAPNELTHRYGYGNPRGSATDLGGYLRPASNPGTPHYGDVTGAGGVRFANQMAEALNIPILILDLAIDGTSILEWTDPQWIGRLNLDAALTTIGGDIEALVWFQGGEDILNDLSPTTYFTRLDLFLNQLQAQLPTARTLEFFEAIQGRGDYPQPHDASYSGIRSVQLIWPQFHANVHPAGTGIDLHLAASSFNRGDGHFTASQYQIMADRYTRAILNVLEQPGYTGGVAGPQIASAVLSGTQVTVSFTHDQGTALTVPNPGTDIEGFELSGDFFNTVLRLGQGIQSAQLSPNGQDVVIELDTEPVGTLELRYLYGMNPFGHKSGAADRRANGNTVYDNFQYHPERTGLPVHPTTSTLLVTDGQ